MKEYVFNENGVCINCDEEILYRHGRDYVILCTARIDGVWVYGWKIELPEQSNGGEWFPCAAPVIGTYNNANIDELRIHAIKDIAGRLEKHYPKSTDALRAVSQLNPEQMNLF